MDIPTYYEGRVNIISVKDDWVRMWLASEENGQKYYIYYYGELTDSGYICGTDEAPELIYAVSTKTNKEIMLFDGAICGYDNMCVSHAEEASVLVRRKLKKLDTGPVRVMISAEYSIDFESIKDDFYFTDEDHVVIGDDNKVYLWDDLKSNGITGLSICLIDEKDNRSYIVDADL
ncbi:MAG: hypothetical protein FWF44_00360 [Defluviitaleaceae bacterium]|nr:hypothetical protein [Defluviitaleaceae bacterium]